MQSMLLDAAGHRRSPATMPGYHQGRPPRNKGITYPADPLTVEEIVAVLRAAGQRPEGVRLKALIVILWRTGLRIGEALALAETDLDRARGAVLVRRGKGGKRREVGMDRWAWNQLDEWLKIRAELPVGALLCVVHGQTARKALGSLGSPQAAPPHRDRCRCPPPLRAAPSPARARGQDGARGCPARRDPAPAWAREPWDNVDLPARHRQFRDRPNSPLTASTGDIGDRRPLRREIAPQ